MKSPSTVAQTLTGEGHRSGSCIKNFIKSAIPVTITCNTPQIRHIHIHISHPHLTSTSHPTYSPSPHRPLTLADLCMGPVSCWSDPQPSCCFISSYILCFLVHVSCHYNVLSLLLNLASLYSSFGCKVNK